VTQHKNYPVDPDDCEHEGVEADIEGPVRCPHCGDLLDQEDLCGGDDDDEWDDYEPE